MVQLETLKEELFYEYKGKLYIYDEIIKEFNFRYGEYVQTSYGSFILLNKSKNISDLEERFSIPDDMAILQEVIITSGTFVKTRQTLDGEVKTPFSDIIAENSEYGSFIYALHEREFLNDSELFNDSINSISRSGNDFELQFFHYSGRVTFVHRGAMKGIFLIPSRKIDISCYKNKISFFLK